MRTFSLAQSYGSRQLRCSLPRKSSTASLFPLIACWLLAASEPVFEPACFFKLSNCQSLNIPLVIKKPTTPNTSTAAATYIPYGVPKIPASADKAPTPILDQLRASSFFFLLPDPSSVFRVSFVAGSVCMSVGWGLSPDSIPFLPSRRLRN